MEYNRATDPDADQTERVVLDDEADRDELVTDPPVEAELTDPDDTTDSDDATDSVAGTAPVDTGLDDDGTDLDDETDLNGSDRPAEPTEAELARPADTEPGDADLFDPGTDETTEPVDADLTETELTETDTDATPLDAEHIDTASASLAAADVAGAGVATGLGTGTLEDRWHEAQHGFVDNPAQAVHEAAVLVQEVAELASATIHQGGGSEPTEGFVPAESNTEQMRVTMQRYHVAFGVLMSIAAGEPAETPNGDYPPSTAVSDSNGPNSTSSGFGGSSLPV